MNNTNDEMRDEYDLSSLKRGERGKYAKRLREQSNVVVIDDDLTQAFPNSKAVNDALREFLKDHPDVA